MFNLELEIDKIKAELKTLQAISLEKQKTNFKQQLAELLTTTLPISSLITFCIFLFTTFVLSTSLTFIIYIQIFTFITLITFTIGALLSFWQEEAGIIRMAINIGKLYNLHEINNLKSRLEQTVNSGIVDETTFVQTINKIADDYYLFNKPIPKLNKLYLDFLVQHKLIFTSNNQLHFHAKSKNDLLTDIVNALKLN